MAKPAGSVSIALSLNPGVRTGISKDNSGLERMTTHRAFHHEGALVHHTLGAESHGSLESLREDADQRFAMGLATHQVQVLGPQRPRACVAALDVAREPIDGAGQAAAGPEAPQVQRLVVGAEIGPAPFQRVGIGERLGALGDGVEHSLAFRAFERAGARTPAVCATGTNSIEARRSSSSPINTRPPSRHE